jgi:hypothetical protein
MLRLDRKRMVMGTVEKDRTMSERIRRELRTVEAMIGIYCRVHHGKGGDLCRDCRDLLDYARRRVDRCPFRFNKPTCLRCTTHCFKPAMRERIRTVMRYAGPRMPWRHPVLTLFHFIDGKRPVPDKL